MSVHDTPLSNDDVSVEWLDEGRIIALTLRSAHREAIDAYVDAIIPMLKEQPDHQALRVLHDFSSKDVMITPYFKKRIDEARAIFTQRRLPTKSAVIMSNSITGNIIKMIATALSMGRSDVDTRFFSNRDDGLAWLRED